MDFNVIMKKVMEQSHILLFETGFWEQSHAYMGSVPGSTKL
jgi:hypothetical protein